MMKKIKPKKMDTHLSMSEEPEKQVEQRPHLFTARTRQMLKECSLLKILHSLTIR